MAGRLKQDLKRVQGGVKEDSRMIEGGLKIRLYQISNQHKYLKYCSADLFRELILNLTFFLKQGLIIYHATSQPH